LTAYRVKSPWLLVVVCGFVSCNAAAVDLLEVYSRAMQSDPLWQQATYTRLAVRETRTQALIGLLPIDVTANKNFIGIGGHEVRTPAFAAANLSVNLFSWDNWVALKAADATVAQGEANYEVASQSLIQRVSQQYFAVLSAQDTLAADQSALQSVQTQLDQAQQRYNVGLIAVTDVETARVGNAGGSAARDHQ
jgi:outer membrane protein